MHPLRLDLVIRTSNRKLDGLSPTQQREIAARLESRTGFKVAATHDSERSESGKTMDRASLHAVRERVRAGDTDGALVAYLDRLGRAPIEESMGFVRSLLGDGGVLVAADWGDEPIDLTKPFTEDMLVMRLQQNRSMWTQAAARHELNKTSALERGKFIGPVPFGYTKTTDPKDRGRLVPHPIWAPIATEAFHRAARDGFDAARDYLLEAAPNQRIWRTDMVRKMLENRTYLGEHATRGLVAGVHAETGETIPYKPHPALVDLDTFTDAQHAPRARRANGGYLLSGLVFCECGASLIGQRTTHPERPEGKRDMHRYRCSRNHATCEAAALDHYVRTEIVEVLEQREIRNRLLPAGIDEARERLDLARADARAYAQATEGLANPTLWAERAAQLDQEVTAAHEAYETLRRQARTTHLLTAAGELLGDDVKLQRTLTLLASMGLTMRLSPAPGRSRHVPLASRVAWFNDGEVVPGVLAA